MNTYEPDPLKPCSSRTRGLSACRLNTYRVSTCRPPIHDLPPPFPPLHGQTPYNPSQSLAPTDKTVFWELLSPALLGTAGALVLSVFATGNHPLPRGGKVIRLSIVFYSIGTTIAATGAIFEALTDKPPHEKSLYPITMVLVSIILFFAAEYLLLYRLFPDSFTGNIGDSLGMQFLSFVYFSITTLATGNLGDIMPNDLAARALISTEMIFFLYTISTAVQLILA